MYYYNMIAISINKIFYSLAGKVVICFITGKEVNHIVTCEKKFINRFCKYFFETCEYMNQEHSQFTLLCLLLGAFVAVN